jgi:hypothetical protein
MGVVNTTYTFTSTDTITSAKMNNIIDETTFTSDAIQGSTLQVVSPGKLAVSAGGITSNEMAANSVVTAAITDLNVTTAKIADANVTQAKLGTNVVGNGPAFRAYASTATSIPAVTHTKINLASETFDTNSNFASSRFTPTIAGYYLITGLISTDSSVMIGFLASIFKNGVLYALGSSQVRANALRTTVNDIVYLNGSTDYVELYGYHESSGSFDVGFAQQTYFSGCLIRSA